MPDKLFKQARGMTRAFFAHLENQGIEFPEEETLRFTRSAWLAVTNHVLKHKVFQTAIDPFKICAFLAIEVLKDMAKKKSVGEVLQIDPVRECSHRCIDRMAFLLSLESSGATALTDNEKGYLSNMIYHEVTGHGYVGIGANGLATTFSLVNRHGNKIPNIASV